MTGRTLLLRVLHTMVNKFVTLQHYIPKLVEAVKAKQRRMAGKDGWSLAYTPRTEEEFPEETVAEVTCMEAGWYARRL